MSAYPLLNESDHGAKNMMYAIHWTVILACECRCLSWLFLSLTTVLIAEKNNFLFVLSLHCMVLNTYADSFCLSLQLQVLHFQVSLEFTCMFVLLSLSKHLINRPLLIIIILYTALYVYWYLECPNLRKLHYTLQQLWCCIKSKWSWVKQTFFFDVFSW